MKVLLSHDGSECSERAVKYVASRLNKQAKALRLSLLYVDIPMLERITESLGEDTVARLHQENTDFALKKARVSLKRAGVSFKEIHRIGNPAHWISELAVKGRFDLVVMGSHGRTALGSLFLGSVTTRVLAECKVPVLVVR